MNGVDGIVFDQKKERIVMHTGTQKVTTTFGVVIDLDGWMATPKAIGIRKRGTCSLQITVTSKICKKKLQ